MYRLILLFILSLLSQGVISNSKYNLQNQNDLVATPYGERTIHTRWYGKNRTTSVYGNTLGFTGRHYDAESGLYYFRARYYDSGQGRFISRDPAGYIDGMGLYNGYFASKFMMDPSGRICVDNVCGCYSALSCIGVGENAPVQVGKRVFVCSVIKSSVSMGQSCCGLRTQEGNVTEAQCNMVFSSCLDLCTETYGSNNSLKDLCNIHCGVEKRKCFILALGN